jgi:hypothetical protein
LNWNNDAYVFGFSPHGFQAFAFERRFPNHQSTKFSFVLVAMPLVYQRVQHNKNQRSIASRVSDKLLVIIDVVHDTDIDGTGII